MNIGIIGCGRWGSFIAWYLQRIGHSVTLYGRADSPHMARLMRDRSNGLVMLPAALRLTANLDDLRGADVLIISIASQNLRALTAQLADAHWPSMPVVLCMKGLEIGTGARLSTIAAESLPACPIAVWLGPGHVQEFTRGVPNCMVIDSADDALKHRLVDAFSGDLIRFYYGADLLGNEVGAAAKNVIGIAAGLLDGLGLATLKGALMSRGTGEIARLIDAMGGNRLSAYGLCHLGDYEATVFSIYSHNRQFGERFAHGESYGELAEGYYTAAALHQLAAQYGVELPICTAVYQILYEHADPRTTLDRLFTRSLKAEF